MTLLEDSAGGEQPRVLIEIVFNYTEGYLAEKEACVFAYFISCLQEARDAVLLYVRVANEGDRNEFDIPEVPNEPCLLLYPHITMLALLFADQAFAVSSLTSPEQLFRLRFAPGQKQLVITLKEEMAERSLFRRCKKTVRNVQISEDEALSHAILSPQMNTLRSITGMELPTVPYTFRRGNGQALDNSSKQTLSFA